jgi:hypothetical protein
MCVSEWMRVSRCKDAYVGLHLFGGGASRIRAEGIHTGCDVGQNAPASLASGLCALTLARGAVLHLYEVVDGLLCHGGLIGITTARSVHRVWAASATTGVHHRAACV